MNDKHNVSDGRRRFLLLVALFLGPLVAALVLYYGFDGWRPSGNAAHGELLSPMVQLAPGDDQQTPFTQAWTFLVVGGADCPEACAEALLKVRQIRLTLGREMERVGRALLLHGDTAGLDALLAQHPDLQVIDTRAPAAAKMLARIPDADRPGQWIYLVDPLGNLMMRFAPATDHHDIRTDLRRLLKLSRIG